MKIRPLIIVLILLPFLFGFTWHQANQGTVAWDAVTGLSNGTTLPAGDVIKYQLHLKDSANQTTELQEVDTTQATITFTQEGQFQVGVQSVRYNAAGDELGVSNIVWSGDVPNPFGFKFYVSPADPTGLQKP